MMRWRREKQYEGDLTAEDSRIEEYRTGSGSSEEDGGIGGSVYRHYLGPWQGPWQTDAWYRGKGSELGKFKSLSDAKRAVERWLIKRSGRDRTQSLVGRRIVAVEWNRKLTSKAHYPDWTTRPVFVLDDGRRVHFSVVTMEDGFLDTQVQVRITKPRKMP